MHEIEVLSLESIKKFGSRIVTKIFATKIYIHYAENTNSSNHILATSQKYVDVSLTSAKDRAITYRPSGFNIARVDELPAIAVDIHRERLIFTELEEQNPLSFLAFQKTASPFQNRITITELIYCLETSQNLMIVRTNLPLEKTERITPSNSLLFRHKTDFPFYGPIWKTYPSKNSFSAINQILHPSQLKKPDELRHPIRPPHKKQKTSPQIKSTICPSCGGDGGVRGGCFKCDGSGWVTSDEKGSFQPSPIYSNTSSRVSNFDYGNSHVGAHYRDQDGRFGSIPSYDEDD